MTDMESTIVADQQPSSTDDMKSPPTDHGAPVPAAPQRSAAGRRAAQRRMELIRLGQLFEKEHGLKRGRQRLQQLIQHGKRYELEHGMTQPHKPRPSRAKAWTDFVEALSHVVKPAYRSPVLRLAEELVNNEPNPKAA
jgi:hypothetical protein